MDNGVSLREPLSHYEVLGSSISRWLRPPFIAHSMWEGAPLDSVNRLWRLLLLVQVQGIKIRSKPVKLRLVLDREA